MINGIHAIVFTPQVEEVRAFFRDTLGLPNVDAGDGWLIFALPPAELAVHPADQSSQSLYLLCDDLDATLADLVGKGVHVGEISTQSWGRVSSIILPSGTEFGIYQPSHPRPKG